MHVCHKLMSHIKRIPDSFLIVQSRISIFTVMLVFAAATSFVE